jgi:hypothetical protein
MELKDKPAGTSSAYRAGVAVAGLTSFLSVWTSIVRDDGSGAGFFLVIMAVGVGAFAAWLRADGMARTMLGVAVMQATLGLATATAPVTATFPDGIFKAVVFNGGAAALWLVSAACFRTAANRDRMALG